MKYNLKTAEYECLKRISGKDAIRLAREFEKCPFTPTAKKILYNYYQSIGTDIDFDEEQRDYFAFQEYFTICDELYETNNVTSEMDMEMEYLYAWSIILILFVLGVIGKAVIAPVEWTFALYVVGAYLSYTAAIFSFPKIGGAERGDRE